MSSYVNVKKLKGVAVRILGKPDGPHRLAKVLRGDCHHGMGVGKLDVSSRLRVFRGASKLAVYRKGNFSARKRVSRSVANGDNDGTIQWVGGGHGQTAQMRTNTPPMSQSTHG